MVEASGEVLTILAGASVGLICSWIEFAAIRRIAWIGLSVILGGLVSWINGEFPTSPTFLVFDVPAVAVVAFGVILAVRRLIRKSAFI